MESIAQTASTVGTIQKNLEGKQMSYKFENTIGGKLFAKLQQATADCIEYKGKSLAEWAHETKAKQAIERNRQEARHAKMIYEQKRQENLKSYREQADNLSRHDSMGQFVGMASGFNRTGLNIDEEGQYRAHIAFASALQLDVEE
jgi:hypothetical protein